MPNVDTVEAQRRTLDQEIPTRFIPSQDQEGILDQLGYRPLEVPDGNAVPGPFSVWHTRTTGSTNNDLVAVGRLGGADGLVLIADHQQAGKGRQNRSWVDQPGNALLSSLWWSIPAQVLAVVPLAVGLAVTDAAHELTSGRDAGSGSASRSRAAVTLKWPNDVLVPALGNRKLAGILAESAPISGTRGQRQGVVIGMGMNIKWSADVPTEVADRAVALNEVLALHDGDRDHGRREPPTSVDVLCSYLRVLGSWLDDVDPASVLEVYRARCDTVGRRVRFETVNGVVEGVGAGIDDSGALVVTDASGVSHHLRSGDAHHL